jgi:hypothetical protein
MITLMKPSKVQDIYTGVEGLSFFKQLRISFLWDITWHHRVTGCTYQVSVVPSSRVSRSLKTDTACSFERSASHYCMMQHHIPEEPNPLYL